MAKIDSDLKLPEDIKNKFNELKTKFDKYILGIALLPADKENKNDIGIFVLVYDSDSKDVTRKLNLRDRLISIVDKIAKEIDQNFKPFVLLNSELIENC